MENGYRQEANAMHANISQDTTFAIYDQQGSTNQIAPQKNPIPGGLWRLFKPKYLLTFRLCASKH